MRENGSKAKLEVTANFTTPMGTSIRATGLTTKLMAKAPIYMQTEPNTQATGAKTYKTGRVFTSGQTAAATTASSELAKSMVWASSYGTTTAAIVALGCKT
jgi:hypothetical protein